MKIHIFVLGSLLAFCLSSVNCSPVYETRVANSWFVTPLTIKVDLQQTHAKAPAVKAWLIGGYSNYYKVTVSEVGTNNFKATIERYDGRGRGYGQFLRLKWTEESTAECKASEQAFETSIGSSNENIKYILVRLRFSYTKPPLIKVNTLGLPIYPDRFETEAESITENYFVAKIKRTDSDVGWGQNPTLHWTETSDESSEQQTASQKLEQYESCQDVFEEDSNKANGVYHIAPSPSLELDVFCDIKDGGWIVIQKRFDGSVNFRRNFSAFREGFGTLDGGEFWLGLHTMHKLTQKGRYKMKIELESWEGVTKYALYSDFSVGPAPGFRLRVGGFSGTVGYDALKWSNDQEFTAFDQDNDNRDVNCAEFMEGAFWWNTCGSSNLNSYNYSDQYSGFKVLVWWKSHQDIRVGGYSTPLKKTVMKIMKY